MYETIKSFNKQFSYEPEIKNSENLVKKESFLIIGMGGSAHVPKILKDYRPEIDISIQQDYSLPKVSLEKLKNKLVILSSYSGNTEEVISAFEEARTKDLDMAVISTGGKLLSLAKENNVPYIELPNTGIQPRSALGYSIKAFVKLIGTEKDLTEISKLSEELDPLKDEGLGKELAKKLKNYVPIVYTSVYNSSLAELWKIKFNETGKIPAFYNILPELNHNEMTGFDVKDPTRELNNKFYFLLLKDQSDGEKISERMAVLEKLYKDRDLKIEVIETTGKNIWHKIFSSLLLADWTAYYIALEYGLDPEQVPMVEEFKKLLS